MLTQVLVLYHLVMNLLYNEYGNDFIFFISKLNLPNRQYFKTEIKLFEICNQVIIILIDNFEIF